MTRLNGILAVVFVLLVVVAWQRRRRVLRDRLESPPPEVDDRAVDRILREGRLETDEDEPLDLEEIDEEERRFWDEEDWDRAERF